LIHTSTKPEKLAVVLTSMYLAGSPRLKPDGGGAPALLVLAVALPA